MSLALWRILLKAQAEPDAPLTCDECLAILNCLADEAVDEAGLDTIWQAVNKHLARCPGCREQYWKWLRRWEAKRARHAREKES